jgi:hypothetical protein
MSMMKITITTRGVKGAPQLSNEFFMNLPRVLGQRPLEEYAANVAEQMQSDAPVLTGYLRNNIRSYRVDPFTMSVTAWAPYSGWANLYSRRPHYFENNTFSSKGVGALMMGDASREYLRTLINKYQNGP